MSKNTARLFHLGDILSVTTGYLVSPRHIEGVYDILNYMTGDNLFTHQLPRARRECHPYLLIQHPQLDGPEMAVAVTELIELLEPSSGSTDAWELVDGWLAKQVARYGEHLPVEPIPHAERHIVDPILEAEQMVGKEHVIVVEVDTESKQP